MNYKKIYVEGTGWIEYKISDPITLDLTKVWNCKIIKLQPEFIDDLTEGG